MSRCLDAGWRSPKPRCTCGAGDDAPGTAHYSVRFPYSTTRFDEVSICMSGIPSPRDRHDLAADYATMLPPATLWPAQDLTKDCPVYLWGRGCDVVDQHPTSYQCPIKSCGKTFTYCRVHGGAKRAEQECNQHVIDHVIVAVAR